MMTPVQVRDDLLRLLGMEIPSAAPGFILQVVADCFNGALQELFEATGGFFRQTETIQLSTTAGTASFSFGLEQRILSVKTNNPGGDTGRPLKKLFHFDHVSEYADLFGDSDVAQAYYVSQVGADTLTAGTTVLAGTSALDVENGFLFIAPPGVPDTRLRLNVTAARKVFDTDSIGGVTIAIPVPDAWVELYFLPLARKWGMRSHYWIMKENAALYDGDYQTAIGKLRAMNPRPDIRDPQADVKTEGRPAQ